ncbi:MAG TPA: hypothetical protein VEJ45_12320 [Candidatus Acidoferrales bacterium]|nr:hypothetical protein [Candidatus Acidoferrales bacterium]
MTRPKRHAVIVTAASIALASAWNVPPPLTSVQAYAAASPAPAATPVLVPDKGRFRILVNGQQMGKEEFEINPDAGNWFARGSSEIQTSEGTTRVSGTLALRSDGSPMHYQWATEGKKKASATIDFSSLTATIELHLQDAKPYTQQFTFNTSPIAVLDNNLYHQYAILACLYDRQKKGPQTFSVLVPQELTPGTITVDSVGIEDVAGKKLEELTAKTADLEVDLYLDSGRLVRLAAPSTNAEIVRE